jgi:alanine racemase
VAALLGEPLRWDGCFTHFHSADTTGDATATQWARLKEVVAELPPMPSDAILHACNSPGALRRPDFAGDAVRPGIFLYGGVAGEGIRPPAPVAALRARVTLVREAREGDTVG